METEDHKNNMRKAFRKLKKLHEDSKKNPWIVEDHSPFRYVGYEENKS